MIQSNNVIVKKFKIFSNNLPITYVSKTKYTVDPVIQTLVNTNEHFSKSTTKCLSST